MAGGQSKWNQPLLIKKINRIYKDKYIPRLDKSIRSPEIVDKSIMFLIRSSLIYYVGIVINKLRNFFKYAKPQQAFKPRSGSCSTMSAFKCNLLLEKLADS